MTRIDRKSEAQANADALVRRTSTFATEHAVSWQVRMDRPSHEPTTLRGYVNELRDAYAAEVPARIHVHSLDGGGTPAFSRAMELFLFAPDDGTDSEDNYRAPTRAALRAMRCSPDEATRMDEAIVRRVVCGMSVRDATLAIWPALADAPTAYLERLAMPALRKAWRRLSSAPLPIGEAVA